eukprot:GHUV01002950.1.p1 GENE.GHUV01002950.1~~GHUV01002950.1.p1  ORF type:complete len:249 (+),score=38.06 GHUV01002950.1:173-919(+)
MQLSRISTGQIVGHSGRQQRRRLASVQVAQQQQVATENVHRLDDEYNRQMQKQMHWDNPFEYHFDRGLYMHEVHSNLICGTQPRNPQEIEQLAKQHRVDVILNLQQDKDMQYWGIDWQANQHKYHEAIDFDPHSLRKMLPSAVKAAAIALRDGKRVYVHCTAGLGRAPAVCIAWLYWFGPFLSLDEAYNHLTSIRPCGPKKDAIRGATYDILDTRHFDTFFHLPERTWAYMNEQDKQRLQQRIMRDWQ